MVYGSNSFFLQKTLKPWWSHQDHCITHGKHGSHTMIVPLIMAAMLRNMTAMASSWHGHGNVSTWSWYIQPWYTLMLHTKISCNIDQDGRLFVETADFCSTLVFKITPKCPLFSKITTLFQNYFPTTSFVFDTLRQQILEIFALNRLAAPTLSFTRPVLNTFSRWKLVFIKVVLNFFTR